MRIDFVCLLSKSDDCSLSAFLGGGTSSTSGTAGLASVIDGPSSGGARVSIAALARHRVSKVSGSVGAQVREFGAHACESKGVRGFSGMTLVISAVTNTSTMGGPSTANASLIAFVLYEAKVVE